MGIKGGGGEGGGLYKCWQIIFRPQTVHIFRDDDTIGYSYTMDMDHRYICVCVSIRIIVLKYGLIASGFIGFISNRVCW